MDGARGWVNFGGHKREGWKRGTIINLLAAPDEMQSQQSPRGSLRLLLDKKELCDRFGKTSGAYPPRCEAHGRAAVGAKSNEVEKGGGERGYGGGTSLGNVCLSKAGDHPFPRE